MKTAIIILGIIALFVLISIWNYRRFMPKPVPLGNKEYKVITKKLCIPVNGKNLYGELLLPEGTEERVEAGCYTYIK